MFGWLAIRIWMNFFDKPDENFSSELLLHDIPPNFVALYPRRITSN
jgi:hypothetical protein